MDCSKELLKQIVIKQGDITLEDTGAIVNAANPSLLGGGGVDGAIHRAAGPKLLEECKTLGGCRHGEARITRGYNLKAEYIIHTPGPIYRNGSSGERKILTDSYWNCMRLAKAKELKSIAFPAISTGIYGYPKREACEVAMITVLKFMKQEKYILEVRFVVFDRDNYQIYLDELQKLEMKL